MEPREVQDGNNIKWQCIQAFAGVKTSVTEKAADHAQGSNDTVTVVCTPSGGAQTVRLNLTHDWNKTMSDDALLQAIEAAAQ